MTKNKVKRAKIAYAVASALMIVLGLVLIIHPEIGITTVCYIVGALAILFGAVKIIGYFSKDLFRLAFQFDLALGIFSVILGVILIAYPGKVASAISFVYGIYAIIDSVLKLQTAYDAKKFGFARWWVIVVLSIVTCCAGLFLVLNPFEGSKALLILLGISLLADGIENLCTVIYTVRTKKTDKKDGVPLSDDTEYYQ